MKIVGDKSGATVYKKLQNRSERKGKRLTSHGSPQTKDCGNCGKQHDWKTKEQCPAHGKTCNNCGKANHFAAKCRSKRSFPQQHQRQAVRTVAEVATEEVFSTYEVATANLNDSQLVTLKLESGNYLRFQLDTGAQCNVSKCCPNPPLQEGVERLQHDTRATIADCNRGIWRSETPSHWPSTYPSLARRLQMPT